MSLISVKIQLSKQGLTPSSPSSFHAKRQRIHRPLLFFILILTTILLLGGALLYIQNKNYIEEEKKESAPALFEVDHLLIKVLLKEKEFAQQDIRVMNIADRDQNFKIIQNGLDSIVSFNEKEFSLSPGQTKIITLSISTTDPSKGVEQQPGVYVGNLLIESEESLERIPLIVEIESKNVLFDSNLNPTSLDRNVLKGSEMVMEVRLFNLETVDAENVEMDYTVKDLKGNTLITESETVVVKTQASFFKTIEIPEKLSDGTYIFGALSKLGNSVGSSSYLFEVISPTPTPGSEGILEFCKTDMLCRGLSGSLIVLLLAIAAYFYLFLGAFLYGRFGKALGNQPNEPKKSLLAQLLSEMRKNKEVSLKAKEEAWHAKEREIELSMKAKEERIRLESEERRKSEERAREFALKQEALRKEKELEAQELARKKEEQILKLKIKEQKEIESRKEEQKKLSLKGGAQRLAMLRLLLFGKKTLPEEKAKSTKEVLLLHKRLEEASGALKKGDITYAKKIYEEVMRRYHKLSTQEKSAIYPHITGFYKDIITAENTYHTHAKEEKEYFQRSQIQKRDIQKEEERKRKEERDLAKQIQESKEKKESSLLSLQNEIDSLLSSKEQMLTSLRKREEEITSYLSDLPHTDEDILKAEEEIQQKTFDLEISASQKQTIEKSGIEAIKSHLAGISSLSKKEKEYFQSIGKRKREFESKQKSLKESLLLDLEKTLSTLDSKKRQKAKAKGTEQIRKRLSEERADFSEGLRLELLTLRKESAAKEKELASKKEANSKEIQLLKENAKEIENEKRGLEKKLSSLQREGDKQWEKIKKLAFELEHISNHIDECDLSLSRKEEQLTSLKGGFYRLAKSLFPSRKVADESKIILDRVHSAILLSEKAHLEALEMHKGELLRREEEHKGSLLSASTDQSAQKIEPSESDDSTPASLSDLTHDLESDLATPQKEPEQKTSQSGDEEKITLTFDDGKEEPTKKSQTNQDSISIADDASDEIDEGEIDEILSETSGQSTSYHTDMSAEEKSAQEKIAHAKRSAKLRKYLKEYGLSRKSLSAKKMGAAKKHYLSARKLYIGLDYFEKKEVYDDLNALYSLLAGAR